MARGDESRGHLTRNRWITNKPDKRLLRGCQECARKKIEFPSEQKGPKSYVVCPTLKIET